jgi:bifunctional UDP-N-acetylglucosamine pyrophosphorylase/glucosamine-1-phosphate N-acetyltransferase
MRAGGADSLAILSVILANPVGYGRVLRDNAHHVYRIVEQKDATRKEQGVQECNTGLMQAPAGALKRWLSGLKNNNAQGEYYLTDVVAVAVRDGFKVNALIAPTEAEVLGVNDKQQLAALESEYRRLQAAALMATGVTIIDPNRLDVRGMVIAGRDVTLDVNVILEGRVQLGHRVIIGAGCVLQDVTIGDDTVIRPYSVLQQATIGTHCVVGPFARLRPGTFLADHAHVGNFVEVKNATLGTGSKANHLSYVGDATVGQHVNIGAGTITCNYDGANKWPTTIEDGAFIGSGTMLVAPVTVGENATIAAGSTITQSAPPNQLTVERSSQKSLSHWRRPAKASEAVRAARIAKGGPAAKKPPTDTQ